jgi:hypothetical protein
VQDSAKTLGRHGTLLAEFLEIRREDDGGITEDLRLGHLEGEALAMEGDLHVGDGLLEVLEIEHRWVNNDKDVVDDLAVAHSIFCRNEAHDICEA